MTMERKDHRRVEIICNLFRECDDTHSAPNVEDNGRSVCLLEVEIEVNLI